MPLHPQAAAFLQAVEESGNPAFEELEPQAARDLFDPLVAAPGDGLTEIENITIDGPGGPLPLRIFRPKTPGPHPVLMFFHGGGWVILNLDTHEFTCEQLALKTPAIVVSVDYRLSPETRFPGPVDDCYAATVWASENAERLGAKPGPVAVAGDSAGGQLSAAVALRARDKGLPIAFQALIYPVTDATFDTASYEEFAEGYVLTRNGMIWFWEHFLGPDGDPNHPEASPLRAPDVSGVAPALVITAECDVLRSEGEAYAAKLMAAGVPVQLHNEPGQLHGFVTWKGMFDATPVAHDMIAAALRKAFA